ncbi:hypothetical protein EYF80_014801 [Liparis tanakae]|uniref:Uncharacterized protein n=1 Tax=Liparis tanakae TaxID=230148 RepID=A0A4Z2IC66_9TELE|nr:hypothetical protein EYF80_014801 [Liparis tanakae]
MPVASLLVSRAAFIRARIGYVSPQVNLMPVSSVFAHGGPREDRRTKSDSPERNADTTSASLQSAVTPTAARAAALLFLHTVKVSARSREITPRLGLEHRNKKKLECGMTRPVLYCPNAGFAVIYAGTRGAHFLAGVRVFLTATGGEESARWEPGLALKSVLMNTHL